MKTPKRSDKIPPFGQVTEATSYGPPANGKRFHYAPGASGNRAAVAGTVFRRCSNAKRLLLSLQKQRRSGRSFDEVKTAILGGACGGVARGYLDLGDSGHNSI